MIFVLLKSTSGIKIVLSSEKTSMSCPDIVGLVWKEFRVELLKVIDQQEFCKVSKFRLIFMFLNNL